MSYIINCVASATDEVLVSLIISLSLLMILLSESKGLKWLSDSTYSLWILASLKYSKVAILMILE
jgi:hypothetical protein